MLLLVCAPFAIMVAGDAPHYSLRLQPSLSKPYSYSIQQSAVQELSEMGIVSGISTEADYHILFQSKGKNFLTGEGTCSFAKNSLYGMSMAGIPDTTILHTNNSLYSDKITVKNNGILINYVKENSRNFSVSNPTHESIISTVFRGSTILCIPLPDSPVKVGETWKNEAEGLLGNLATPVSLQSQKALIEYTLVGIQDTLGVTCYVIDIQSKDFTIAQTLRQMNIDMSMEGTGMAKGRYFIHQTTGITIVGTMKIEADLGIAVKEQESSIASMNITLYYSCKIKD